MANDWTRLLQETSKRGGPDALKAFYENRGKLEGAGAMLLLVASVGLAFKARASFAKAKDAGTPGPGAAPGTERGNPTPSGDDGPAPEGKADGAAAKDPGEQP